MKKVSIFFYITFILLLSTGCTDWKWAKSEAVSENYLPTALLSVDPAGNIIYAGNFGAGSTYENTALTNNGHDDVLIAKHTPDGNKIWSKTFGGNDYEQNSSVATDHSGNIILSGNYGSSTLDFGNGNLINNNGGRDCYLAKFDGNGNIIWAKGFGNGGDDGATGIYASCDNSGNIYLSGDYHGTDTLHFGNDVNNHDVYIYDPAASTTNSFIVKYDPAGHPIWAKGIFGGQASGICVDNLGNAFVTGGNGTNIYFEKYSTNGTILFNQSLGDGISKAITCDPNNNVYMTGIFYGTNNLFGGHTLNEFQRNPNDPNINNKYYFGDFFVSKFQAGGTNNNAWVWAKSAGGKYLDEGWTISADNDVVWAGGIFNSTTINGLDKSSTGINNATSSILNSSDAFQHFDSFIAEFDVTNGQLLYDANPIGSDGNDEINSVAINGPLGHGVFVAGTFTSSSLTFDGIAPINKTPSNSSNNWFLASRVWKSQ